MRRRCAAFGTLTSAAPPARLLAGLLLIGLALPAAALAAADEDFLRPSRPSASRRARSTSARSRSPSRIADGYYMYRERFKFAADGATLGQPQIPPGKVKFDETFQKDVETYHGRVAIRVPVERRAAGLHAERVTSQGCADKGLCYPPRQVRGGAHACGWRPCRAAGCGAARDRRRGLPRRGPGALRRRPAWRRRPASTPRCSGGRFWLPSCSPSCVLGLALSFTPCVLPMVPILSSIIVGQARRRGDARAAWRSPPPTRSAWRSSTRRSASPPAWSARAWPRRLQNAVGAGRVRAAAGAALAVDVRRLRAAAARRPGATPLAGALRPPARPASWPACSRWARSRR